MSLFDKEFYPTPADLARKMAAPYANRLSTARILEPSAGNGAILDAISEGITYTYTAKNGIKHELEARPDRKRIYAIERNDELRLILQQKGYRLLASDFLTYRPDHHFDLAIMNPPFSNGDEHLLHAWDILHHGDIACLLNAETVRNPYTATRRRLAAIIAEHGTAEELGPVFRHADNPTDVEVVLVRLHKDRPAKGEFSLSPGNLSQEQTPDFGQLAGSGDSLQVSNGLEAYLRAWALTKESAADFIRAFQRLRLYADAFLRQEENQSSSFNEESRNLYVLLLKDLLGPNTEQTAESAYDHFLDIAKDQAWNQIISQMGLEKYMTGSMKRTMVDFRNAQAAAELNKENIMQLFRMLMGSIGNIMEQCVVDVYDLFTRFYDGNTSCTEGWKTNKRFEANRKIIIPGCVSAGFMPEKYGYHEYFDTGYGASSNLDDIDKAMCWITGTSFEKLDDESCRNNPMGFQRMLEESVPGRTIAATIRSTRVGDQDWQESNFFKVKCFKKGTVHLFFKDEGLWAAFNQRVNKGKNQLGMAEK